MREVELVKILLMGSYAICINKMSWAFPTMDGLFGKNHNRFVVVYIYQLHPFVFSNFPQEHLNIISKDYYLSLKKIENGNAK